MSADLLGPSEHEGTIVFDGEVYRVRCICGWHSDGKPSEARAWYEFDTHEASGDW